MQISAYAKAHMTLPSSYQVQLRALSIAESAAQFIMHELMDTETMELSRTWRDGGRGSKGQADDYAFFIQGDRCSNRSVPNVNIFALFSPPGPLRGIQQGTLRAQ